uniref:circadian associated repressor of transcription a n=1 Tax=Semicossyphus pulcher TaxID=241346 RepID=UPI0037E7D922
MNSLARSSKWPSYDSLPSTSSILHSESEQTEDEADVFSEGEGDSVRITKSLPGDEEITLSASYLDFPGHSDRLRIKRDHSKHSNDKTQHLGPASSPKAATLASSSATPGDLAFAQKCADLHRFICPLLGLLHGLKAGRFDKGLSSFQQSVAMDRLQKILGILQRPEMGEKHLQNLLQIEMMLKIWFPRVAFQSTDTANKTTTPRLTPHWRQNQLHMPVKKRKLSWSDPDYSGSVPTKHKHLRHGQHACCQADSSVSSSNNICTIGSP